MEDLHGLLQLPASCSTHRREGQSIPEKLRQHAHSRREASCCSMPATVLCTCGAITRLPPSPCRFYACTGAYRQSSNRWSRSSESHGQQMCLTLGCCATCCGRTLTSRSRQGQPTSLLACWNTRLIGPGSDRTPATPQVCALLQGWGENDRGVSYTFGSDSVTEFLAKHDLDLICRAHQVHLLQSFFDMTGLRHTAPQTLLHMKSASCTLPKLGYMRLTLLDVCFRSWRMATSSLPSGS